MYVLSQMINTKTIFKQALGHLIVQQYLSKSQGQDLVEWDQLFSSATASSLTNSLFLQLAKLCFPKAINTFLHLKQLSSNMHGIASWAWICSEIVNCIYSRFVITVRPVID